MSEPEVEMELRRCIELNHFIGEPHVLLGSSSSVKHATKKLHITRGSLPHCCSRVLLSHVSAPPFCSCLIAVCLLTPFTLAYIHAPYRIGCTDEDVCFGHGPGTSASPMAPGSDLFASSSRASRCMAGLPTSLLIIKLKFQPWIQNGDP